MWAVVNHQRKIHKAYGCILASASFEALIRLENYRSLRKNASHTHSLFSRFSSRLYIVFHLFKLFFRFQKGQQRHTSFPELGSADVPVLVRCTFAPMFSGYCFNSKGVSMLIRKVLTWSCLLNSGLHSLWCLKLSSGWGMFLFLLIILPDKCVLRIV